MSVLVVDPERLVREFVQAAIRKSGQETFAAGTAQEAFRFAMRQPAVSLLLTEVDLPQKSGPELARDFVHLSPQTGMLFMAAFITGEWPYTAPIICKPFDALALEAAVGAALAQTSELKAKLGRELRRAAALCEQAANYRKSS